MSPESRKLVPLALLSIALLGACSNDEIAAPAPSRSSEILTQPAPNADFDVTLPDVVLTSGAHASLVATVFVDEQARACGAAGTLIAVNGFAHTAASWKPLAEALFASRPSAVCRVVALDLPGHGKSGLPDAVSFGVLTLDDYVSAVLGGISQLAERGISARNMIAHSQGALVAQMAQERLLAQGTSLREATGIAAVVLLAAVPSREVGWEFAESGTAAAVIQSFIVMDDPVLGPHVDIPTTVWPALFFTSPEGVVSPTTPAPADMAASGWAAPEPLFGALQLVGAAPFARPSVRAEAFGLVHGTLLSVIAYEGDLLLRPAEELGVYAHLTGDTTARAFVLLSGPEAVHDMSVSSPAALIQGVKAALR